MIDSTWRAGEGPVKDSYNMGDNPQYRLSVEGGEGSCALWILLSRHITDKVRRKLRLPLTFLVSAQVLHLMVACAALAIKITCIICFKSVILIFAT